MVPVSRIVKNVATMAVLESILCRNVRVFRWNEDIFRNKVSDSEGLALVVIASALGTFPNRNQDLGAGGILLGIGLCQCAVPFNLSELLSRDQNLGPKIVAATQQFPSNAVESLGDLISSYLFTRFQFDPQAILGPNSPKKVVVVEVVRSWMIFKDYTGDSNVEISWFLPPKIPPPRWTSEDVDVDVDVDDNEEDEKDPWPSYDKDIRVYLQGLRKYLGVRRGRGKYTDRWTRRPLTRDEPRGFVEISPVLLGKKRQQEFDRTVDICAICLDGFAGMDDEKISITSCFHVYHRDCISKWLLFNKNSCPTCRLVLPLGFNMD